MPSITETRAIAKEAYIYGFPMVDGYRIQHAYFVDQNSPEFKGPWNQIANTARVYTPADTTVQTPNSDTPYSMVGADLRREPLVLTIPPIDKGRYFSLQFVDLYTHNFAYVGSRSTGQEGGAFLLAGPRWRGDTPKGITGVIRRETELALVVYRTQLFAPGDLENVKKIQAGYKVQPLSAFLGGAVLTAGPPIDFVKPLSPQEERTSPEFFNILNFLLGFCPTNPSETALMERFARLDIGAGRRFDVKSLSPESLQAVKDGIAGAWLENDALVKRVHAGEVTSGDMFGTREHLKNNYLYRMSAAVLGIYGNSREEAMYPVIGTDPSGQELSGAQRYTLRLAPNNLPPVKAFWSVTMYKMPASLLVENPINRYLINSPMLPDLKKDPDGGITIYVQHDSPGADREPNWLPAPTGPFMTVMRLYWPGEAALNGSWKAPSLKRAAASAAAG